MLGRRDGFGWTDFFITNEVLVEIRRVERVDQHPLAVSPRSQRLELPERIFRCPFNYARKGDRLFITGLHQCAGRCIDPFHMRNMSRQRKRSYPLGKQGVLFLFPFREYGPRQATMCFERFLQQPALPGMLQVDLLQHGMEIPLGKATC